MYSESPWKRSTDCDHGITAMKELNHSLLQFSLPPITDRTREPRFTPTQGITLCILGSPSSYLDILLEGGNCCSGDMMLVISPSWLEKVPSGPSKYQSESAATSQPSIPPLHLLVHKAIVFTRGGSTYLDVFRPPRRVTYFINGMPDVFDTAGVKCSINGSPLAHAVLWDMLFWKTEMSRIGVTQTPWALLCYQPSPDLLEKVKGIKGVTIVDLGARCENDGVIPEKLEEFLSDEGCRDGVEKIIVTKRISGQSDVSAWLMKTREDIVKQILLDVEGMGSDDYIYIRSVQAVRIYQKDRMRGRSRSTGERQTGEFNTMKLFHVTARVTVCRGLNDQLVQSQIYASLMTSTNHNSDPVYHTIETTLGDIGITEMSQINNIRMEIQRQVRAVMNKVIEIETDYKHLYIGPRTDFLDIEFSIGVINGIVTPVLQAVRDQHTNLNVGGIYTGAQTTNNQARQIIHVMVMRSHCLLLQDHCMLVLSSNLHGHADLWCEARKYGMKVVLVTPKTKDDMENQVDMLIVYDYTEGSRDSQHARNILTLLNERNCKISGCLAKQSKFLKLAARIREEIGARGPSLYVCEKTYEKHIAYSTLLDTSSRTLVKKSILVRTTEEMENAAKHINFPAVIKFDSGAGAIGAGLVTDGHGCLSHYQNLLEEMKENQEVFELAPTKTSVVLMEYIDGTEHNVDIVMFDGKLIAAFVRDVAPPKLPNFVSTALTLPSNLPEDKLNTLLRSALQTCRNIGITDGCINVDMKMTTDGPKLLEINARHGGHALVPMAKKCYDEDLIMLSYIICCGIQPTVVGLTPSCKAYVLLLRAPQHCEVLSTPWVLTRLKELSDMGIIVYRVLREIKQTSYDKVIAYLGVSDEDGLKAKQTLKAIAQTLGVDKPDFDCSYFLENL